MGMGMMAALGGGGGTAPPDASQGPSPEDLLAQIQQLLQAYLALGGDTPVAAEAQNLMDAIDQTQGQAAGGAPPEGSPAEEATEPAPVEAQEDAAGQGDKYSGGGMKAATAGAKAFLKKQKGKGAKAS